MNPPNPNLANPNVANLLNGRSQHIFVTDFLLSGKTPGVLLAEKKLQEAQWVLSYARKGPPPELAMTDPALFVRLRQAITDWMIKGWV